MPNCLNATASSRPIGRAPRMATVMDELYPAAKRAGSPVAPRDPFFTTHPRPHSTLEASRTVAGGRSKASDRRLNVRGGCPPPAGVAERIHAAWYLIRDPAGLEKSARSQFR